MHPDDPCRRPAPGGPGIAPRWTRGAKDAVGTAYSTASAVWYTLAAGVVTEVYYPHLDQPQIRDLQYLVTDGETFFHDERRHTTTTTEPLSDHCLGVRVVNEADDGLYRIEKTVWADPHEATVLVHTRFEPGTDAPDGLRLFALCAPHLEGRGRGNVGRVVEVAGRKLLIAHRGRRWLALGATVPFLRASCGYVGTSDGWTELHENLELDGVFDCVGPGNVALTGEVDLAAGTELTLGLAFGDTLHNAITTLLQSLAVPVEEHLEVFGRQWERSCRHLDEAAAGSVVGDGGALWHKSHSLLLAHEDKGYPGAMVAALSIPWGESKGDEAGLGGYHLVWTRDLVQSVGGLLATGDTATARRALVYLSASQESDGGFPQNFWLDGTPYWSGVQLDEVAFPLVLAGRLQSRGALGELDPLPMVRSAAAYLIRRGPVTPQERWEENAGFSPSTLAIVIAGLTVAARLLREAGDAESSEFVQTYADFLEERVERWTVTTEGSLVSDVPRHYIRIHPADPDDPRADEDPNRGMIRLANRPPGSQVEFPARDIVDAGFLELVRYGIRPAGDPLIEDSLRVVDAVLRVETPAGPCWRRYNHDGYGQRDDGGPYEGWGTGRAWPFLTGERGHYELAAGRPVEPWLRAMEGFATVGGLLTEQVWDAEDLPEKLMFLGRPTGAAMPLMWAHAEYLKLVRSAVDDEIFDRIPEVAARYLEPRAERSPEIWTFRRRPARVEPGGTLRVLAEAPFTLRWSDDDWQTVHDKEATGVSLGFSWVDLPVNPSRRGSIRFTFRWHEGNRWEGRDFEVAVETI